MWRNGRRSFSSEFPGSAGQGRRNAKKLHMAFSSSSTFLHAYVSAGVTNPVSVEIILSALL